MHDAHDLSPTEPPAPFWAVIGTCAAERHRYARELAIASARRLVCRSMQQWRGIPVDELHACLSAPGAAHGGRIVVEHDTGDDVMAIARADPERLICVVDARHLVDDLRERGPLDPTASEFDARGQEGSFAAQTALGIEHADCVVLVNWEHLATPRLSLLMALVSHLTPRSRVRLSPSAREYLAALAPVHSRTPPLERPGWLSVINGEHAPHMTDRRVRAVHVNTIRPFHPVRLAGVLDDIADGRFGLVLRSMGLCHLATRTPVAQWDHVGRAMWLHPLASDAGDAGAAGCDLALFGLGLRERALEQALVAATLDDDEFLAGPRTWCTLEDPFPEWVNPLSSKGHAE